MPFDGEEVLFELQPSSSSTQRPQAEIRSGDVVLVYEGLNPANAEIIKTQFDRDLALLGLYVERSASECRTYNERLKPTLVHAVAQQRNKILADREVEAALDIPVRRRADPDPVLNIAVPRRRREVTVTSRPPTRGFVPEPVLREILLVVLNNQFGPSGGEMFSRRGKTDVAIRHETGAVFIAECKFWPGEKAFGAAIEQLLRYLIWRDTKSALVLFVRGKNVTAIQEKAQKALREYPRCKRQATDISGCPVFILHHDGDVNREIEVALVVVPLASDPSRRAVPPGPGAIPPTRIDG